jgi:hypothetical protein
VRHFEVIRGEDGTPVELVEIDGADLVWIDAGDPDAAQ